MAEVIEPEKMSEEELKQKLYELDGSGSPKNLIKKELRERFNYTARQTTKISKEGEL